MPNVTELDEKTLVDIYNGTTGLRYGPVPPDEKLMVRLWDGMDGCWTDVAIGPRLEVLKKWYECTDGGTKCCNFDSIDYYRLFPDDGRKMAFSGSNEMFRDPEPEPEEEVEKVPVPKLEDMLVMALVTKLDKSIILDWDAETGAFMVVDFIPEQEKGSDRPAPRLEYQLSDGLPGDRGYSEDCYSYEEAQAKWGPFLMLCKERMRRR